MYKETVVIHFYVVHKSLQSLSRKTRPLSNMPLHQYAIVCRSAVNVTIGQDRNPRNKKTREAN